MQANIVSGQNGDDLQLVAENNQEQLFLQQLANAGTLNCITPTTGLSVTFRPVSVVEEDFSGNTAAASNSIGRYNFSLRQNERKVSDMTFIIDGAPLQLADFDDIYLQVKKHKNAPALISLSVGYGLEITDANILRITFEADKTKQMVLPQYHYDIMCKSGVVNTYYVEGVITSIPSITR